MFLGDLFNTVVGGLSQVGRLPSATARGGVGPQRLAAMQQTRMDALQARAQQAADARARQAALLGGATPGIGAQQPGMRVMGAMPQQQPQQQQDPYGNWRGMFNILGGIGRTLGNVGL